MVRNREPEERRHRPILGRVFGQPARSVDERLLEHVVGVDPALQPPVEPQLHHPAEPRPLHDEELPQRLRSPAWMRIVKSSTVPDSLTCAVPPVIRTDETRRLSTGPGAEMEMDGCGDRPIGPSAADSSSSAERGCDHSLESRTSRRWRGTPR